MKLNVFYKVALLCCIIGGLFGEGSIAFELNSRQHRKMKLLVVLVEPTEELRHIAHDLKGDLSCNAMVKLGFNMTDKEFAAMPKKADLQQWFKQGYSLVITLVLNKDDVEWRLFDAQQGVMKSGKRVGRMPSLEGTGHAVADSIWQILTGQEGIFSTMIAFCRERHEADYHFRDIYVQNPFTRARKRLVEGGKPLAPRWHTNPDSALLLYSEATPSNVRLMSSSMSGERKVVSNYEGLNIAPSFSQDGKNVVYCFTHEGKSHLFKYGYDRRLKKPALQKISDNDGNNTSPCLRDNGDVIFCSDFETKGPQLYYYHAKNGKTERLTEGGYCAAPAFCEKNQKIAYCKMVNGITQLWVYDLKARKHKQLTFDNGNKDECSWSPCGNYLVYSHEARIALINLLVQEPTFLTPPTERCSYPCWSGRYNHYVEVTA